MLFFVIAKEKFGVTVDEEIVREVDELLAEYDDLEVNRSEIVEIILTAFAQSGTNHGFQKVIIRKRKSSLYRVCIFSARISE